MLENREITRRLYPNLMPIHKVQPVDNYPQILYQQLKTLVDKNDPEIVLLTRVCITQPITSIRP